MSRRRKPVTGSAGRMKRLVVVLVILVAGLVLLRHLARRGTALHQGTKAEVEATRAPAASEVAGTQFAALGRGERSRILRAARARLESGEPLELELSPTGDASRAVVVTLSRSTQPALVSQGEANGVVAALEQALDRLARRASAEDVANGLLKVDLVAWMGEEERPDSEGRVQLDRSLVGVMPSGSGLFLLPEELLAWRMVDSSGKLRDSRLRTYLKEGGREVSSSAEVEMRGPFRQLRFDSFSEGPDGLPIRLYRGNPLAPDLSPAGLLAASAAGGDYLLRHLKPDGWFDYIYEPKRDEYEDDYNLLRHAGSCYSLVELARATGDARYLEGARRGLETLLTKARGPKEQDSAADFEAIVSPGEEAKLGGSALALLALVEYQRESGDDRWLPRARAFARHLGFRQEADGRFHSKYFYGDPDPEPFESIYYPGEAILALARLHEIDPNPAWLATAQKGADWLIQVRDQGKGLDELPHDHWLLMALDELDAATGEPLYAEHAKKIATAILRAQRTQSPWPDWIGSFYDPPRSTPTATRAEALVAMVKLARRKGLDDRPYLQALQRMAAFQLRTQLGPANSQYVRRPDLAEGGFRRSLTTWELRIDYTQHNLSALLGLRDCLR